MVLYLILVVEISSGVLQLRKAIFFYSLLISTSITPGTAGQATLHQYIPLYHEHSRQNDDRQSVQELHIYGFKMGLT